MTALLSSRTNVRDLLKLRGSHQIRSILNILTYGTCPFIRRWRRARDYSGLPALHPCGAVLRAFKFAPGKFVEPKGPNQILILHNLLMNGEKPIHKKMAESEGFEPSIRFPVYTLSRGAPSATRPALPYSSYFLVNEHYAHISMAHVRVTPGVLPCALRAISTKR